MSILLVTSSPRGAASHSTRIATEFAEKLLAADPSNVAGWVMLMRSRMTLNQPAKAAKALKDAIAANPGSAQRLKAEAAVLNVPTV